MDPETGALGDGDPIDVIELGSGPLSMGSVVAVKVLGSMALIDEGETDHKILAIRESDPLFNKVNDMNDLERVMPGVTAKLVDWLKNYKTSDGKPVNQLKHDEPTTKYEALQIIKEVSGFYKALLTGKSPAPNGYKLPASATPSFNYVKPQEVSNDGQIYVDTSALEAAMGDETKTLDSED